MMKYFPEDWPMVDEPGPRRAGVARAIIRAAASAPGAGGVYLGAGATGPAWGGNERAVLVLGPPRSGKTSSIVVPAILGAAGAVVSTSTKPDVLTATAAARAEQGPCFLYDPSGTVTPPPDVEPVRWSPVTSCASWDDALLMARALVRAARPGRVPGADHWTERAEALLGPLLHAAALQEMGMTDVLAWVDRRESAHALGALDASGATIAGNLLAGIAVTDPREQSGIWSTASGVLGAYRSEAALATTVRPNFDGQALCEQSGTLYVCATGRRQAAVAPLVVGLVTEVRAAAYARAAEGRTGPPVLLALDEVANIAPIDDLPAMVSEGGGQGLLTLACLQDLSQARSRWGPAADGFLSLFGIKIVLPGIGDTTTLQALSRLAGDEEVVTRSISAPAAGPGGGVLTRLLRGRRGAMWPAPPSVTTATVRRPRLAVDDIARGHQGAGLVVDERNAMGWVRLTPWFAEEPWRSAAAPSPRMRTAPAPGRDGPGREGAGGDGPGRGAVHPPPEPDLGR